MDGKAAKLNINILTPRGVKFERIADFVSMRGIDGDLGILPRRADMSHILGDGILNIYNDGEVEKLALFEGIVEVRDDDVNIYTTIAQRPEEIDLERARQEKADAEAAIREETEDLRMDSYLLQIRRALVRLEVATYSDEGDYFSERAEDLEEQEDLSED